MGVVYVLGALQEKLELMQDCSQLVLVILKFGDWCHRHAYVIPKKNC